MRGLRATTHYNPSYQSLRSISSGDQKSKKVTLASEHHQTSIEEQKHSTSKNDDEKLMMNPYPSPPVCRPKKAMISFQDAEAPLDDGYGDENIFYRASIDDRRQSKQMDKLINNSVNAQRYESRCFSFAVPKFVDSAAPQRTQSQVKVGAKEDETELSLASQPLSFKKVTKNYITPDPKIPQSRLPSCKLTTGVTNQSQGHDQIDQTVNEFTLFANLQLQMQTMSDPSAIDPECDSVLDHHDDEANAARAMCSLDDDVTQASSKFYSSHTRPAPTTISKVPAAAKKIFVGCDGGEAVTDEKIKGKTAAMIFSTPPAQQGVKGENCGTAKSQRKSVDETSVMNDKVNQMKMNMF